MKVVTQKILEIDTAAQSEYATLPAPGCISIKVAHSIEEMMQAFAIRAAVFLNEQDCPYAEEFDGNDFAATHVLGLCGEEPVATMRIRYFSDFAKPERLAVRRGYRNLGMAAKVVDFGVELCRQKGYRRLYGHAQARLLHFWKLFDFHPIDRPDFVFSDHRYVEIERILDPHPDPVTIGKDPFLLIRPEGAWDRPGVLDRSSNRPATCPTGDD